jgi:hypothetical protein
MPTPFSIAIGYHTCARELAERIQANQTQLQAGPNQYDWLGSGVYFWVGNYLLARWWLNVISGGDPAFQGATLKYEIRLENCLDLSDSKYLRRLSAHEQSIDWASKGARPQNEIAPPGHIIEGEYKQRFLDHAVIDDYCTNVEPDIEMVYGLFRSGKPIYRGAGQYAYNNAQLAIRPSGLSRISLVGVDSP